MAQALLSTLTSFQSVLTWTPNSSSRGVIASPHTVLKLPDLLGVMPNTARDFSINTLCKEISLATEEWATVEIGTRTLAARVVDKRQSSIINKGDDEEGEVEDTVDLRTGLLASMCFPTADRTQLKLCTDFISWTTIFEYHLATTAHTSAISCIQENLALAENEPGSTRVSEPGFPRGLQNILVRLEHSPESVFVYDRFRSTVISYLQLLGLQISEALSSNPITSFKTCVANKSEKGWHTSLFILIEYAQGLKHLNNALRTDSTLKALHTAASEAIVYALDIYSCAGAASPSSSPFLCSLNSVTLISRSEFLSLFEAISRVGSLCTSRLQTFSSLHASFLHSKSNRESLLDKHLTEREATIYVNGLKHCLHGILHWVFESERYFGRDGAYVRLTLTIETEDGREDEITGAHHLEGSDNDD